MKEKNSKICQLNLKIQDLKTKLSNCIIIYNDIKSHLKKEIDSLKVEISEKSANFEMEKTVLETKLKEVEQDLLRKTKSFDQLIWSWAELEKFKEEEKNQSKNDERFEMGKRDKGLCMYFVKQKKCTIPTCPFAHSIAAVKAANPFYKTGPCKEFQNGACNYGNFADVEGGHPTNWCGRIHLSHSQEL